MWKRYISILFTCDFCRFFWLQCQSNDRNIRCFCYMSKLFTYYTETSIFSSYVFCMFFFRLLLFMNFQFDYSHFWLYLIRAVYKIFLSLYFGCNLKRYKNKCLLFTIYKYAMLLNTVLFVFFLIFSHFSCCLYFLFFKLIIIR